MRNVPRPCADCGAEIQPPRRGAMSRYCVTCRTIRNAAQAREYAKLREEHYERLREFVRLLADAYDTGPERLAAWLAPVDLHAMHHLGDRQP